MSGFVCICGHRADEHSQLGCWGQQGVPELAAADPPCSCKRTPHAAVLHAVLARDWIALVDQTKFGGEDGDCLAACLATLLRLDIGEVPSFFSDDEGTWREKMGAWLVERGWGHLCIAGPPPDMLGPALTIVSGKSPRGDWLHATVWRGRELLHDPHPSRAGLVGEPVDTIVLVPLA